LYRNGCQVGLSVTKGLTVKCRLDTTEYQKGIKITDEELNAINMKKFKFHSEWNYVIKPNKM
jgi:hypothetical protein